MGHPGGTKKRVCCRDGRSISCLHAAAGSQRPLVCLDESSKQLIRNTTADPDETRAPKRHDYEYERNGVANIFMMFAPLEGWRRVKVTDRHTAVDYAHVLKELADVQFPNANNPGAR
jgi:hypothetical protein